MFITRMENMCSIFMYIYTLNHFAIDVASKMMTLVDEKAALTIFCKFMSYCGASETGTNYKKFIYNKIKFSACGFPPYLLL